jgi:large subunit ribosomal protein L11
LKRAAQVAKGAKLPGREGAGQVSREQVLEIARTKMQDLNAFDEAAAMRIVEGTARSMGITVLG